MTPLRSQLARAVLLIAAAAVATPAFAHFIVDLAVDIKAPSFVAKGATFNYTVDVTNLAYDPTSAVEVDDVLPAGVRFVSATGTGWRCTQSGGHVTCGNDAGFTSGVSAITITVTAPQSTGSITNTAKAELLSNTDPFDFNDTGSAQTVVYDPNACSTAAPAIVAPADGASSFDGRVDLRWTAVPGASKYRVWSAIEGASPSVVVETTQTHVSLAAERGASEWWVEAVFDGCPSAASPHVHISSAGAAARYTVADFAGRADVAGSDDGPLDQATFVTPVSIGIDVYGNMYVADADASTIRRIRPNGTVSLAAGRPGFAGAKDGATGGVPPDQIALLNHPRALAVGPAGFMYIADSGNHTIRYFDPGISTPLLVSGPFVTTLAGSAGNPGTADGEGSIARFTSPQGIAVSSLYKLVAVDTGTDRLRQLTNLLAIDHANVVTTIAGVSGSPGSDDGTAASARFNAPAGTAIDAAGNVYVADTGNNTIRRISADGVVTTVAGSAGAGGLADGVGAAARFNHPTALAFDSVGNLYVADTGNHAVRRVAPSGLVTTIVGNGNPGHQNGSGTGALLHDPTGIAIDPSGRIFIADSTNHVIRIATPQSVLLPDVVPVTGGPRSRSVRH